jgi:hypothetical protein
MKLNRINMYLINFVPGKFKIQMIPFKFRVTVCWTHGH